MDKEFLELSKKYKFENIKTQIDNLNKDISLNIGFLGEFSSGKSTLINALINKRVLPAMEKPTSKSIIELIPSSSIKDDVEYFELANGDLVEISPMDFQEIALGRSDGKAIVKVKPTNIIKEGYRLIDTPGISSIDETDTDITYGYLPFLDGAVICQDINNGTLNDTIISFLNNNAIKPIADNFIFVLTRADDKDKKSVESIKNKVIKLLKDKNIELKLKMNNIEQKVITISAEEYLNKNKEYSLEEIEKAFQTIFIDRKITMQKQRKEKELIKIGNELIFALKDLSENFSLDDEELTKKEIDIKKDIEKLEEEKDKFDKNFSKYSSKLYDKLLKIADNYIYTFGGIRNDNKERMSEISKEFAEEMLKTSESFTEAFMKGISIPKLKNIGTEIEETIKNILNITELGKLIGLVVATAGIGGAEGVAGNALEAVEGGAVFGLKDIGKSKVLENGKKVLKEAEKEKDGFFQRALGSVGQLIQNVNPLEYIGDYIAGKVIVNKTKIILPKIANKVSDNIIEEVKDYIDFAIYEPLENKLKQKEENIEEVRKEQNNNKDTKLKQLEETNNDLTNIRQILKNKK